METSKSEKKEHKLVLPPDVDPEVKKDLMQSDCNARVSSIEKSDGKLKAEFSYSEKDNYRYFTKFFDNWKQLGVYAEKFLALSADDD